MKKLRKKSAQISHAAKVYRNNAVLSLLSPVVVPTPRRVLRERKRPQRSASKNETDRLVWLERGREAVSPAYWPTLDRIVQRTRAGGFSDPAPQTYEDDPTLALFAQWAEEDATDDPKEIARRRRENEETATHLQDDRFSLEGRTVFEQPNDERSGEDPD